MARVRRWLVRVTWLGLAWALLLYLTGGFVISLGPLHASSRGTRNPLLLAALAMVLTWGLGPRGHRTAAFAAAWREALQPLSRVPAGVGIHTSATAARVTVAIVAVVIVGIGLVKGSHVAGGSDSYGYVSQAHLWATGTLRVTDTGATMLPAGISSGALIPFGYRLTADGSALVPMYAPGLPMQMALFERLGGRDWVFLVMPLLAGVAVWATYALGRHAGGNRAGVLAALLFAASPTVLFQLTHAPMSDLPAAAWWTLALAALFRPSRRAALLCGLAAGAAILTRPNLVPLAAIPGSVLLWDALRSRNAPRTWQRLALFAGGSIPACVAIAALNTYWYGAPLASGYGDLAGTMYRWDHFWPNLARYAQWAIETQGPALVIAAAVPALSLWTHERRGLEPAPTRRVMTVCGLFVVTTWLSYVFYLPFVAWWTLRFLLPAFPALFVLVSASLFQLTDRVPARGRSFVTVALVAVAIVWGMVFAQASRVLDSTDERRFATIGRYLAEHAPRRSVVLAKHHSGSARYYSDHLTIRFDEIPPSRLDAVVAMWRQRGYSTFIALDDWEAHEFRNRFAGASRLGALDWPPETTAPGAVLYAAARQR